jgi:para-nitrobenzyl esterase
MRITKAYVLLSAVVTLLVWPTSIALAKKLGTTVETRNGLVLGIEETKDGYETWSWEGIPFAQPPERWKAPQPPENWGTLNADTFGSKCPQYDGLGDFSGDEDCLYLNVWRPRTQERNLPVYFYIHGGGNSTGTGSNPMTLGNKLAARGNMVVVTANYRLGPLGWFVLPESLQDEDSLDNSDNYQSHHHGDHLDDSGNYGTLDIIQALRWVRANIAAFGGNPNNITIAGESAGGFNVCTLLISPLAKGLFHRAISESGGFFNDTKTMDAGRASAQAVINALGCTNPSNLQACLMSKSPKQIFAVYPRTVGGMLDMNVFMDRFTDGTVISALGKDALKDPETYNQVPTILGTNKEEWKLFMLGLWGTMPPAEYQAEALFVSMAWQQAGVNDLAEAMSAKKGHPCDDDYRQANNEIAAAMSANKGHPGVYAYEFDYGAYNEDGYNAWPDYPYYFDIMIGAAHSFELPFIFGEWTFYGLEPFVFRPDNQEGREALSDSMVEYWASFARTGKPRDPGGVQWRPWSNEDGGAKRILLDANATQSLIQMSDK